MKKIESEILQNFRSGNSIRLSQRDRVQPEKYTLWGHPVVELADGKLVLCDCGWNTRTTASRLNAFLFEFNAQKDGKPVVYRYAGTGGFYCDGKKIAGGCIILNATTGEFIDSLYS